VFAEGLWVIDSTALLVERSLDGPCLEGERGDAASGTTESKSGGGSRSWRDDEAANAIASGPYGTPNRANDSRDEITLSCSAVGPVLG